MIFMVRHGQTDWNLEKRMQGQTDIELNETGRMQAKELSNKMPNLNIKRIYSSDLLRAKETAQILNKKIGTKIIFDERLREFNYGDLEGVLRENITPEMWNVYDTNSEEINAESRFNVYKRVKNFLDEIKESEENSLIVAHGGILRMMLYQSENDEFDNELYNTYMKIKFENANLYEFIKK